MACTTILVGRKVSYDGSCIIARNDDSGAGKFTVKRFTVVHPQEQPRDYTSVISHAKIKLPDDPMRYTACPNVIKGNGIWAACGVNEANVGMSATETITSNARVLGADPLVEDGIGEEDLVTITLPYIRTAREGVERLGKLHETYGTYEMNGIAFCDSQEIWWFESIGGHHWMARRVPDDRYVVMPNQQGIDAFDFKDAYSKQKANMCSADLKEFVEKNHLDLSLNGTFDPRAAFGSHDDSDHVYNTPRAWYMLRYFNPSTYKWDGPNAQYGPRSDDLPWSMVPEKKITIEDVKYILSAHFQGTPYDPYAASSAQAGAFRSIGVNRNCVLGVIQTYEDRDAKEWIAFASNPFNVLVPFYADVNYTPEYMDNTTQNVSTDNFYWSSRLMAAMADASYKNSLIHIERYQNKVAAQSHEIMDRYDHLLENAAEEDRRNLREKANQEISDMVQKETIETLDKVLYELSMNMKNAYARSDA